MSSQIIGFVTDTLESLDFIEKIHMSEKYTVVVFTENDEVIERISSLGYKLENSLKALLEQCKTVVISMNDQITLEKYYLSKEFGFLRTAHKNTVLCDMSRVTPMFSQEIAHEAELRDLTYIDCPVDNTGAMFVGLKKTKALEIKPLLELLSAKILWFDVPGKGLSAYLAQQIAVAGVLSGLCDALAFANSQGVESAKLLDAFSSGQAQSYIANTYAQRALDGDMAQGMKVATLKKDIACSLVSAQDSSIMLPMSETAFTLLDMLGQIGGDSFPIQALYLLYQDEAASVACGLDWSSVKNEDEHGESEVNEFEGIYTEDDDDLAEFLL